MHFGAVASNYSGKHSEKKILPKSLATAQVDVKERHKEATTEFRNFKLILQSIDLSYHTPNFKSLERAWSRGIVDRTKGYRCMYL